jgi:hypothetical protein
MNKHIQLKNTIEKTMETLQQNDKLMCGIYLARDDCVAFADNGIIITIIPLQSGGFQTSISTIHPVQFIESKHNTRKEARRYVWKFLEENALITP